MDPRAVREAEAEVVKGPEQGAEVVAGIPVVAAHLHPAVDLSRCEPDRRTGGRREPLLGTEGLPDRAEGEGVVEPRSRLLVSRAFAYEMSAPPPRESQSVTRTATLGLTFTVRRVESSA